MAPVIQRITKHPLDFPVCPNKAHPHISFSLIAKQIYHFANQLFCYQCFIQDKADLRGLGRQQKAVAVIFQLFQSQPRSPSRCSNQISPPRKGKIKDFFFTPGKLPGAEQSQYLVLLFSNMRSIHFIILCSSFRVHFLFLPYSRLKNTGKAGSLLCGYKPLLLAGLKAHRMICQPQADS